MTRGDQRDRDRAKAQAKQAQKVKQQGREGRPDQRNLNDSAALAAKIEAKKAREEKEQTAEGDAAKGPVAPKPKAVKNDGLDDLLSAGLPGSKGKKK